jgi:chemotaxis protein CheX
VTVATAVDAARLTAVAPEIWDMMLSVGLDPVAEPPAELFPGEVPTITGLVTVAGDWTGAVSVQTSVSAAQQFAAAMFMLDDVDDASTEDVRDATAELTNMTGGNVKNLLPGVSALGIPTVTHGVGYVVRLPRCSPVHQRVYSCDAGWVLVTIFEPG